MITDNEIIECSVEEYKQLKKQTPQVKPQPTEQITLRKEYNKNNGFWNERAHNVYEAHQKHPTYNLTRLFKLCKIPTGGKNTKIIRRLLSEKYGLIIKPHCGRKARNKKKETKTPKKDSKKVDNRVKRMKYIINRAFSLMKQDYQMKYDTAFRRASEEWQNRSKVGTVTPQVVSNKEIADLLQIAPSSVPFLEKLLRFKIIKKQPVKLEDVEHNIVLSNDFWHPRSWDEFTVKMVMYNNKIKEWLNTTKNCNVVSGTNGKKEVYYA